MERLREEEAERKRVRDEEEERHLEIGRSKGIIAPEKAQELVRKMEMRRLEQSRCWTKKADSTMIMKGSQTDRS